MKIAHASGRFSKSAALLDADIDRWCKLAGIVTLTEVASADRAAIIARAGWTRIQGHGPGPGECAILIEDRKWEVLESGLLTLTEGGGRARLARPISAPYAVLRNRRTGRVVLVSTAHLPAHIEGHLGRLTPPWVAWFAAVKSWRIQTKAILARYPGADLILAADWNLNFLRAVVRRLVSKRFPGLTLAFPKAGTHGPRAIDGVVTTLRLRGAKVLKAHGSDHDAVLVRLRGKRRKPKTR